MNFWKRLFKKKKPTVRTEPVIDTEKELAKLLKEFKQLDDEYNRIYTESAKKGLPYEEMEELTREITNEMYFKSKKIRLYKEPELTYGKQWNGKIFELEKFKDMAMSGEITDNDGYGEYATLTAKSDISIYPSDILENIYRTDFTHVIWFNK